MELFGLTGVPNLWYLWRGGAGEAKENKRTLPLCIRLNITLFKPQNEITLSKNILDKTTFELFSKHASFSKI